MTASGDFIPSGDELDSPNVPTVFGVRMTPTVLGAIIALAGVGAMVYILLNFVQPVWQRNQELLQEVTDKQAQLVDPNQVQIRITAARAELQKAQQLKADVLTLFATEDSLDTLLLDINARVQAVNAGIQDEDRRATLSKFELIPDESGLVTDSSLGAEVNNRLERRVYTVEMKGNFAQTQSILRNIERLQPLLIVRDFNSELDSSTQEIRLNARGQLTPTGQPETRITTSFKLIALVPAPDTTATTPTATPGASPSPGASPTPTAPPAQ